MLGCQANLARFQLNFVHRYLENWLESFAETQQPQLLGPRDDWEAELARSVVGFVIGAPGTTDGQTGFIPLIEHPTAIPIGPAWRAHSST